MEQKISKKFRFISSLFPIETIPCQIQDSEPPPELKCFVTALQMALSQSSLRFPPFTEIHVFCLTLSRKRRGPFRLGFCEFSVWKRFIQAIERTRKRGPLFGQLPIFPYKDLTNSGGGSFLETTRHV